MAITDMDFMAYLLVSEENGRTHRRFRPIVAIAAAGYFTSTMSATPTFLSTTVCSTTKAASRVVVVEGHGLAHDVGDFIA